MSLVFFSHDPATTEIYTLSLHDALPISWPRPGSRSRSTTARVSGGRSGRFARRRGPTPGSRFAWSEASRFRRSEEHTSELQSLTNLVCRLLLEKKKTETEHESQ